MSNNDMLRIAAALTCTGACTSTKPFDDSALRIDVSLTMGAKVDRIADMAPTVTYSGGKLTATSSTTTSDGYRFVVLLSSSATTGTLEVGPSTPVQAGFSVPGMTGTIFYDSGTFAATVVEWSADGQIEGTFSDLHRAADALGLAPESSAEGAIRITVPKQ